MKKLVENWEIGHMKLRPSALLLVLEDLVQLLHGIAVCNIVNEAASRRCEDEERYSHVDKTLQAGGWRPVGRQAWSGDRLVEVLQDMAQFGA